MFNQVQPICGHYFHPFPQSLNRYPLQYTLVSHQSLIEVPSPQFPKSRYFQCQVVAFGNGLVVDFVLPTGGSIFGVGILSFRFRAWTTLWFRKYRKMMKIIRNTLGTTSDGIKIRRSRSWLLGSAFFVLKSVELDTVVWMGWIFEPSLKAKCMVRGWMLSARSPLLSSYLSWSANFRTGLSVSIIYDCYLPFLKKCIPKDVLRLVQRLS